jgi:catechol 2,3-dioxygenase-like lactoylglutathione lyase family enzyme
MKEMMFFRQDVEVVAGVLGSDLGAGLFHKPKSVEAVNDKNPEVKGRTRKMAVRFNMVSLFVNDLEGMTKFYRDVIGLKVKNTEANYTFFEHEGIDFALFVCSKLPEWLGQQPLYPGGLNGTFALSQDLPRFQDVDAEFDRLVKAGAKPVRQPWDAPWGQRTGTVADPDGNLIEIGSFNKG